jgi:hypothetical protein
VSPSPPGPNDCANESLATIFESPRPQRRPEHYSLLWVTVLLAADVAMFTVATTCSILLVHANYGRVVHWEPPTFSAGIIIAVQLLIFERLGLYKSSVALSLRDELYHTSVALTLGAAPLLVLFTLLPALSSSRMIIFTTLTFSIIAVGGSRAMLRELRALSEKRRPQRVAIVGRRENTNVAAESLNFNEGSDLLRIDVDNMDEALAGFASPSEAACNEISWFADARNWGCDLLLLTETVPPRFLPTLLALAARYQASFRTAALSHPRFLHTARDDRSAGADRSRSTTGLRAACSILQESYGHDCKLLLAFARGSGDARLCARYKA